MRHAAVALVLCLFVSACSGDGLVEPATGTLEITTTTAGVAVSDGYTIKIDGGAPQSIGHNAVVRRTGIATGSHSVELGGLPGGCTTAGENSRTITVTAGSTAAITFAVDCAIPVGAIRVVTATSGEASSGYGVLLDGTSQGSIEPTGSRVLEGVSPGTHTVELSDVPGDCGIVDDGTRSVAVTAGATVEASFLVLCDVGAIRVVTTTTGEEPRASYSLVLDGIDEGPIVSTGVRVLTGLSSGLHEVALSGVPSECQVAEANPFTATVYAANIIQVSFNLYCGATAGWSLQSTQGGNAIWGSSGMDVYALSNVAPDRWGVLHYDGLTWRTLFVREDREQLSGIWGSSARDVFAVGGWNIQLDESPERDGVILHYDGSSWTVMRPPILDFFLSRGSYHSVWGPSGTDVFAVGMENRGTGSDNVGLLAHYDGTEWSRMTIRDNAESFDDVHGTSSSDVWAVSNYVGPFLGAPYSSIWHYDGNEWAEIAWYEGSNLSAVWANSATSVFAVGGGDRGEVFHYDGSAWTPMTVPLTGYLREVWGTSDNDVYAVGQNGILHFDGSTWTDMGVNRSMNGVWGASATDVFAIGEAILHRAP